MTHLLIMAPTFHIDNLTIFQLVFVLWNNAENNEVECWYSSILHNILKVVCKL